MFDAHAAGGWSVRRAAPDWFLAGLRLLLVALLAKPALSKFLSYGSSVAFFDAIGMPYPAAMVIVAGVVEAVAGVLLLLGIGDRLAALSLIPVMLVAMLHVGPDWKNLAVLLGAAALVVSTPDSKSE